MGSAAVDLELADAETAEVEFKAQFVHTSRQDWCELIKDIVAIANSGGGWILIGVNDDGSPSGFDVSSILSLDPADIANKIHSYTEEQFDAFEIARIIRGGNAIAVLRLAAVRVPMVFTSPGTYPTGPATQKTAFSKGTVYFRHGAKSEPGTSADLAAAIERELTRTKEFWLSGIAKVVAAPPDSSVQIVAQPVALTDSPDGVAVRLTSDETANAFRVLQADQLYPYRQTELLKKIRERLGDIPISAHDLLCVRRIHMTDANPTFSHKARWSPRQYSEAFLLWLVDRHIEDGQFFRKARDSYKQAQ